MRSRRGFILFEAMLAVTIFALAVLALGKCVDNCLRAEMLIQETDRARRALENRMAEIESGAITVGDAATDELKDAFAGMKLRQSAEHLQLKNENDEEVSGIDKITLELTWTNRGAAQVRTLDFYVMPRNR